MINVRYAVCSERDQKPVVRVVVETRAEADKALDRVRQQDASAPEAAYWIAELGPESEAWRALTADA